MALFAVCPLSALIALLTWCPWGHPAFGLLVVIPWSLCPSRRDAWFAALAYYLTAAWQIPPMSGAYFAAAGQWPWLAGFTAGVPIWFAWCGLLAAGQATVFLRSPALRPVGVLLGLVLTVVPPLGWLSIMSPLNALGYWFPGTHWFGLILGAVAIVILASKWWRPALLLLATVAVTCHVGLGLVNTGPVGSTYTPVDTRFGPEPKTLAAEFGRARAISDAVLQELQAVDSAGPTVPRVLVFPEMAVNAWRARSEYWLDEAVQATADGRVSWITGAMKVDAGAAPVNGVLVVEHGQVRWLDGQVSFPGAMWRPGGFSSPLGAAPVVELAGKRAAISICYEDLVPWAQWKVFLQQPELLVSISSLWVVKGIDWDGQARSAGGWARMFDVPTLRATNL